MKVIPRASAEKVLPLGDNRYKIYVKSPALEGKANERTIELVAGHFGVKKQQVRIARGETSRNKWIEIDADR